MNKIKIGLGVFIFILTAMVSAFFVNINNTQPSSVLAIETSTIKTDEAGSYEGTGFYPIGETAVLKATMNNGYRFLGWIEVDENGNWEDAEGNQLFDNPLSTEPEYSFVVERNIYIGVKWEKIEYSVSLGEGLEQDFELNISNDDGDNNKLYYNDEIMITVNNKNANYIYNLTRNNIYINQKKLEGLLYSSNIQNGTEGFKNFQINLNITEDIVIDIDFDYVYVLELKSASEIPIESIVNQNLISVQDEFGKLSSTQYLIWSRQAVTLNASGGDDVYQFVYSQFNDQSPSILASQTFMLEQNSTFTVLYRKIDYQVEFEYYLKNTNGGYDPLAVTLYELPLQILSAGQEVTVAFDNTTNQIAIDTENYDKFNVIGYRFIGITTDNNFSSYQSTFTFTMDEVKPKNSQIQILFELIEYRLRVEFVDEFFKSGVQCSLSTTSPTVQTEVTVSAHADLYQVVGWSWQATPTAQDYIATTSEYTFQFEPANDDDTVDYVLYLDINYKYTSASYTLSTNSILKNMDYDVVAVSGDANGGSITFSSSEYDTSELQITYTAEDVTTNDGVTTIDTKHSVFGKVKINNAWTNDGSMIYGQLSNYSIATRKEGDTYVYAFQKYTYFANLQIVKIESISINKLADEFENGTSATITLGGTAYEDNQTSVFTYDITGTVAFDSTLQAYKIDYTYPIYIFKDEDYTKLQLMGAEYQWDGNKFAQTESATHTLTPVTQQVNKVGYNYNITLNNLRASDVLMLLSTPVDATSYGFVSNSKNGSILTALALNTGFFSMLHTEQGLEVLAEYVRLEGDIILAITNRNAYSEDKVKLTINGSVSYGLKITALENYEISIEIVAEDITAGYQFNGFKFEDEVYTDQILTFTMGTKYINKIIYLMFAPIEYTINIHYLDQAGKDILDVDALNGVLSLNGAIEQFKVNIEGEFEFVAKANSGYYLEKAYFGTEAYILTSLIQTNASTELEKKWTLNSGNFQNAILDLADGEVVQLYIKFAIHTYTASVYFEIGANETRVSKPTILFNNTLLEFKSVAEATKDRYKAVFENIEYGKDLTIKINKTDMVKGITFHNWKDSVGALNNTASITINGLAITISGVDKDIELIAVFDYVEYDRTFVYLDENGEQNKHGSATSSSNSYVMFQTVTYSVAVDNGYVLTKAYYLNNTNEEVIIDGSFEFTPQSTKIENNEFKIYLKFDLKTVNLTIKNSPNTGMDNKYDNLLERYEVVRTRNGVANVLTDETGYQVQTGDKLTVKLYPMSVGIEIVRIEVGDITLGATCGLTFTLDTIEIKDETVTGVYYELTIIFNAGTITPLETNTDINNIFDNREYALTYTHTLIDYNTGIRLSVTDLATDKMVLKKANENYTNANFAFGTFMKFTCGADSLLQINSNFVVKGFKVAGEDVYTADATYLLNSLEMWEQIALNVYNSDNPNRIEIVLNLSPKISLHNATSEEGNVYIYKTVYNGEAQGLSSGKEGADVVVGGGFDVVITYSTDKVIYTTTLPKDSAEYDVKIYANIGVGYEMARVEFDGVVTYKITPKVLTVISTFSKAHPLAKIYDGETGVHASNLYSGLKLEGVCGEDKVSLDSDRIRGNYSSSQVNIVYTESDLYNVTVTNLYLWGENKKEPQNYELQLGDSGVVFERIGQITPKTLYIRGFAINNKVYDGSTNVVVNTDNIQYDGKLESDSTKIITSNLKFYLEDGTVGYKREVLIDFSEALTGADSTNYTVSYNPTLIDVYPYEKECKIEGFGVIRIVDRDKKCLIPINAEFIGYAYINGSTEYRAMYPIVETYLKQTEDFDIAFEVKMKIGVATTNVSEGLYLYMPRDAKLSKVLHFYDDSSVNLLDVVTNEDYDIIKVGQGKSQFAVIRRTTYIALWIIILIIVLALLLILLLVLIFIIVRNKKKKKYSINDRI